MHQVFVRRVQGMVDFEVDFPRVDSAGGPDVAGEIPGPASGDTATPRSRKGVYAVSAAGLIALGAGAPNKDSSHTGTIMKSVTSAPSSGASTGTHDAVAGPPHNIGRVTIASRGIHSVRTVHIRT